MVAWIVGCAVPGAPGSRYVDAETGASLDGDGFGVLDAGPEDLGPDGVEDSGDADGAGRNDVATGLDALDAAGPDAAIVDGGQPAPDVPDVGALSPDAGEVPDRPAPVDTAPPDVGPTCPSGRGDCDGNAANGCEVNTSSTLSHCGGCGRTCGLANATARCAASACTVAACDTGFGDCNGAASDGCEVDLRSRVAHCGTCGRVCTYANASGVCTNGTCSMGTCNAGFSDCNYNPADGCETLGACVYASCNAIPRAAPTGAYTLNAGGTPWSAYCDMTTDGGGWTLLATVHNTMPTDTRRWNTDAVFTDATTFGSATATDDYKGAGYTRLPANDLLVMTDEYHFGFRALLGGAAFGPYVRSQVSATCATSWLRSGVDFASSNLSTAQRQGLGLVVRGLDPNAGGPATGCATTGFNENNFISFAAGIPYCLFGVGNCTSCNAAWSTHDNGMLNRDLLTFATCTAGTWPCNANNLQWTSAASIYGPETKTRYVQLLVR